MAGIFCKMWNLLALANILSIGISYLPTQSRLFVGQLALVLTLTLEVMTMGSRAFVPETLFSSGQYAPFDLWPLVQ